eukprot:12425.XXX_494839_495018_1 [CDS] Oithona nana genome sequencing.
MNRIFLRNCFNSISLRSNACKTRHNGCPSKYWNLDTYILKILKPRNYSFDILLSKSSSK